MAKNKAQDRLAKIKNKVSSSTTVKKESKFKMPMLNTTITILCIAVAAWFSYKGYLETRVNTPYDVEKVSFILIFITQYFARYNEAKYLYYYMNHLRTCYDY